MSERRQNGLMDVVARAGRRTNLALLLLLAGGFMTGWLAFAVEGRPQSRVVGVVHGVLGLGILVLAPWKRVIVRRGLHSQRGHAVAIGFTVLVVVSLTAGIAHAVIGPLGVGPVNALNVHVASAVAAVPVALLHVVRRRQRPRRADLSRRSALRAIAIGGTAALAYAVVESVTSVAALPGSRRRATGSYEAGSGAPSSMPVTQWFTDGVPRLDPNAYELLVRRLDEPTRRISHSQLLELTTTTQSAVLDCTGGWWAEQDWRGVRLDALVGIPESGSIVVRSITGYTRRFPPEDARALLLATQVGGVPLSPGHGAPLRLVAPGRRGFWWVKWVAEVSVDPQPWWSQSPFPLQ